MAHRDLLVIGRERGRQRCRRVAVDQQQIRRKLFQHRLEAGKHRRGDLGEPLAGFHHVQIVVGFDPKQTQNLVQHFAVLSSDRHTYIKAWGCPEDFINRSHLNGFWASPKDEQYFFH